jgi:hypothetical protein
MLFTKLFQTFQRKLREEIENYPSTIWATEKNNEDEQFEKLKQELELLRDASAGRVFDL